MSHRVNRWRVSSLVSSLARSEREVEQARERADQRRVATWHRLSEIRTQQAERDLQRLVAVPVATGQRRNSDVCAGQRRTAKRRGMERSARVSRTALPEMAATEARR